MRVRSMLLMQVGTLDIVGVVQVDEAEKEHPKAPKINMKKMSTAPLQKVAKGVKSTSKAASRQSDASESEGASRPAKKRKEGTASKAGGRNPELGDRNKTLSSAGEKVLSKALSAKVVDNRHVTIGSSATFEFSEEESPRPPKGKVFARVVVA